MKKAVVFIAIIVLITVIIVLIPNPVKDYVLSFLNDSKIDQEEFQTIQRSIETAIMHTLNEYDIHDEWIVTDTEQSSQTETLAVKKIDIPGDLHLEVVNLALTRSIQNNGYDILSGKEIPEKDKVVLVAGTNNTPSTKIELIKNTNLSHKKGTIALIVEEFGENYNEITQEFIELPARITIAVIPGREYSNRIARDAAENDKEVMINLPMESKTQLDKEEKYLLTTSMDRTEIAAFMEQVFSEIPNAKGLNNYEGSLATENVTVMRNLANILRRRGLYFVDSITSTKSKAFDTMSQLRVRTKKRNIILDTETDRNRILYQLDLLKEIAKQDRTAIGLCRESPLTLEILKTELPKLKKKGYEFSFISDLFK